MSAVADYYCAPDPDTAPSGRTGALGNPYRLSDLSCWGGSAKTVSAGDIIGALSTGNAFVAPASCTLPAGNGTAGHTIFRGCPASGTFDQTRAIRPAIEMAGYSLLWGGHMACFADLHCTKLNLGVSSDVVYASAAVRYCVAYNLELTIGAGTGKPRGFGMLTSGMDHNAVIACQATGLSEAVVIASGGSTPNFNIVAYNTFDSCSGTTYNTGLYCGTGAVLAHNLLTNGSGLSAFNAVTILHNTLHNTNSGITLLTGTIGAPVVLGNLVTNCGAWAYDIQSGAHILLMAKNAWHTATSGGFRNLGTVNIAEAPVQLAPNYVGGSPYDYTPQETTLPSLGEILSGTGPGRNLAGSLTAAGGGGGGVLPARARLLNTGGF